MGEIEFDGDSSEVREDLPAAEEPAPPVLELVEDEPAEELPAPTADPEPAHPTTDSAAFAEADPADLRSSLAAVVAGLEEGDAEEVAAAETQAVVDGTAAASSEAADQSEGVERPEPAVETAPPKVVLPYAAYGAAWVAHALVSYVVLRGASDPLSVAAYPALVYSGLALVVAAPFVVLWAWLAARARTTQRAGLLSTTLLLVSGLAALGVVGWWTVLLVVDAARGAL